MNKTINGFNVCEIVLDGTECKVDFTEKYKAFAVRNDADADVLVSIKSGKNAGDAGVMRIPAGQSAVLNHNRNDIDAFYIKGTGTVNVMGVNDAVNPFKSAAKGGGSSGGNAINENLLTNPDFAIAQRNISGNTTPTSYAGGYCFDRWKLTEGNGTSIMAYTQPWWITHTAAFGQQKGGLEQVLEFDIGDNYSISYKVEDKTTHEINPAYVSAEYDTSTKTFKLLIDGDHDIYVYWCKLEVGNKATPFVKPNPADEWAKCRRFYEVKIYDTSSGVGIFQYWRSLNHGVSNIDYFPKYNKPRITVNLSYAGNATRALFSDASLLNPTSAEGYSATVSTSGIDWTFGASTTACSSGWIDRFQVILDAEIY